MDSETRRIAEARITPLPKSLLDPMPRVLVRLEGEAEERELFSYYPDEISFSAEEFVGRTLEEGVRLKFERDREYLRS